MAHLTNPYNLEPATGKEFVGREDILTRWQERLTPDSEPWKVGKSWMVVGPGGIGKTSLLQQLQQVAREEFEARVIWLDLGLYRELDSLADLFHDFGSQLPKTRSASGLLRKAFGLPPDSTDKDVALRVGRALLSKAAIGFSGASMGVEFSGPDASVASPGGIAARLAQLFNSLAVLAEEQTHPVVVLLDQLGKTHDNPRWRFIAEQFLLFVQTVRREPVRNLVFTIGIRPERQGELAYQAARELFSETIYHFEDVHPLTGEEGVEAILVRSQGHAHQIELGLARRIVEVIQEANGHVDPYALQLGTAAVWDYLYGHEQQQPDVLRDDQSLLREVIGKGHARLVEPVRNQLAQWTLIRLLAFHPAGLTLDEIAHNLANNTHISASDLQEAAQALMSRSDRRLLSITPNSNPHRFRIAHDLLRDYITSQVPIEERQVEQARKLLLDSTWRYRLSEGRAGSLSDEELQLLWDYRQHLEIHSEAWNVIVSSELQLSGLRILDWLANYKQKVGPLLSHDFLNPTDRIVIARQHFLSATELHEQISAARLLAIIATHAGEREVQKKAVEGLAQLGETALPFLSDLALSANNKWMRESAAWRLAQVGEVAIPVLSDLARSTDNEWMRYSAARGLTQLGEVELALPVLSDLARSAEDERVRPRAAERLAELGEAAVPVLSDLARSAGGEGVRQKAAGGLAQLGEVELALPVLSDLARSAEDEGVRQKAAGGLAQLGEVELALSVLSELARSAESEWVRQKAAEVLAQLGEDELALSVFSDLARSGNVWVRQSATGGLVQLGEAAVPVLSDLARSAGGEGVRRSAIGGLAQLGEAAVPVLSDLARSDGNEGVRQKAAEELAQLGEVELALPVLSDLARSAKVEWVRRHAAEVLAQLGKAALPALNDLVMNSHDTKVQPIAVEGLARLPDAERILLRLALRSPLEGVGVYAAIALLLRSDEEE